MYPLTRGHFITGFTMKNKLKVGLSLLWLTAVVPIQLSNANVNTIKQNDTIKVVGEDGTESELDVYSFTEPYDETAITEDGLIKIGEGYTSDGVYYEAFKPAVE